MKTLTRVPLSWSSEIIGFSHAASSSRSHPWSEVTASGPSGTRVHCTGCAFRASSRNSGKGFPSMLNSTLGWSRNNSASSRTSRSEEHTSELQSHSELVCRLLLDKKKQEFHHL